MLGNFMALISAGNGACCRRMMFASSLRAMLLGASLVGSAAWQPCEAIAQDAVLVFEVAEPAVAVVEAVAEPDAHEPDAPGPAAAEEEAKLEAGEQAKERPAGNARKAAVAGGLVEVAREMAQALQLVAPRRAQPAQAAVNDAQQAQIDALKIQIRSRLVTEVSFAKRVCQLNAAEEAAAVAAAKTAGSKFAEDYIKANGQFQNGIVMFVGEVGGNRQNDPISQLQTDVAKAIEAILPEEKRAQFHEEVRHRNEFRQNASAANLTALIDERLLLSGEQRTAIEDSLTKAAGSNELPPIDTMMHMGAYLPAMPEEAVTRHLDPGQRKLWGQIQKINFGVSFEGNHNPITGGAVIDDVDLGDE